MFDSPGRLWIILVAAMPAMAALAANSPPAASPESSTSSGLFSEAIETPYVSALNPPPVIDPVTHLPETTQPAHATTTPHSTKKHSATHAHAEKNPQDHAHNNIKMRLATPQELILRALKHPQQGKPNESATTSLKQMSVLPPESPTALQLVQVKSQLDYLIQQNNEMQQRINRLDNKFIALHQQDAATSPQPSPLGLASGLFAYTANNPQNSQLQERLDQLGEELTALHQTIKQQALTTAAKPPTVNNTQTIELQKRLDQLSTELSSLHQTLQQQQQQTAATPSAPPMTPIVTPIPNNTSSSALNVSLMPPTLAKTPTTAPTANPIIKPAPPTTLAVTENVATTAQPVTVPKTATITITSAAPAPTNPVVVTHTPPHKPPVNKTVAKQPQPQTASMSWSDDPDVILMVGGILIGVSTLLLITLLWPRNKRKPIMLEEMEYRAEEKYHYRE